MKKKSRSGVKFGDEDEENEQVSGVNYYERSEVLERAEEARFLNENILDGNIFDYDGLYDSKIKEEKAEKRRRQLGKGRQEQEEKGSRYLHKILNRANERKIEKNIMLSNVQIQEMKREGRQNL